MKIHIESIHFKEDELKQIGKSLATPLYDKSGKISIIPDFYMDEDGYILSTKNKKNAVFFRESHIDTIFSQISNLVKCVSGGKPLNDEELYVYIITRQDDSYSVGLSVSRKQLFKNIEFMPITLTQEAANEIRRLIKENNLSEHSHFCLDITGKNKEGFKYSMKVANTPPTKNDYVSESHDITITCDKRSRQYLHGSNIKFVGNKFVVENPNE